jgi:DNA gyrase/topoisomerase IV subunit B
MNKEQAEHLIKILEAIKTRPGIYIGDGYIPEKIRMLLRERFIRVKLGKFI